MLVTLLLSILGLRHYCVMLESEGIDLHPHRADGHEYCPHYGRRESYAEGLCRPLNLRVAQGYCFFSLIYFSGSSANLSLHPAAQK